MQEIHFVVDQKRLLGALSSMQPLCSRRTPTSETSSIFFNVCHKELILKGTDLEISLQTSIPIIQGGSGDQVNQFLVPGKRIFDIVRELEGDIAFAIKDSRLSIAAGGVDVFLNISAPDLFPPFPERIENIMGMPASFFLNMLNYVSFLVPQNNANPALNGLFLEASPENLKITATDGHCLTQVCSEKHTLEEQRTWLIPRRTVLELKKLIEPLGDETIFLGVSDSYAVFSGSSFNLFSRTLSYTFPEYQQIIQREGFLPAKVDRSRFVKTLRRSACLLSGQFISTNFEFTNAALKVSMQNDEVGSLREEVPLSNFKGNAVAVRFYAPYLLSGLQVLADDEVSFYLKGPAKPIIFESINDDIAVTYLVMPVAPVNGAS